MCVSLSSSPLSSLSSLSSPLSPLSLPSPHSPQELYKSEVGPETTAAVHICGRDVAVTVVSPVPIVP